MVSRIQLRGPAEKPAMRATTAPLNCETALSSGRATEALGARFRTINFQVFETFSRTDRAVSFCAIAQHDTRRKAGLVAVVWRLDESAIPGRADQDFVHADAWRHAGDN